MTEKQKQRKNRIVSIVLFSAFGVAGYFFGKWIIQSRPTFQEIGTYSPLGITLLIIGIFISFHVVIFLHELGHIIGGLLAGDSFGFMVTGPLHIESDNGRLRLRFNRDLSLYGGLALTYPQQTTNFKKRRIMMVAGGPVASLLTAIVFELLAFTGEQYLSGSSATSLRAQLWIDLSYVTAVLSLFIFLVTIIPLKTGGFMSDGMQLVYLFQDKRESKAYAAINQLFASSLIGTRPRNFNEAWLNDLQSLPDNTTMGVAANLYYYYFHLDRGDPEVAGRFLRLVEQNLKTYPSAFRKELLVEIGIYAGAFEKDLDKTLRIWKAVRRHLERKNEANLHIYRTIIASLEHKTDQFRASLEKANEALKQSKEKGLALMQRDMLRDLLVEMKP
jgi:hypothetical protein